MDSFVCELEFISKEIKKFIGKKNITRITQANDSIIYGCFCIVFINFILKGKSLLDYINLFSLDEYEKNDNTKLFSITWN